MFYSPIPIEVCIFVKINKTAIQYMATTLSYKEIGKNLECFKLSIDASEVGFTLLRCIGDSEVVVKRYRDGKGIVARFDGLLIKKKLAFRACVTDELTNQLESLKADVVVAKNAAAILCVSDGETILGYDPYAKESYENLLNKVYTDYSFFSPLWGVGKYRAVEENPADVKAAENLAKLHDEIRRYNDISSESDVHDLNIFMTRLLFCFFAEDTGIFEDSLFTRSVKRFTKPDGSDLSEYLSASFEVMDMPVPMRIGVNAIYSHFPYVNGGLFRKRISVPQMGIKARDIILKCGDLDWANINPDIFGSMIQAVVTPELRGELGMHYTSVPNIMKLIGPLFLNDLLEEYDLLRKKQENIKNQQEIGIYTQKDYFKECKPLEEGCKQLLLRISKMKFFDPACGSGNFLIITYKQLRLLETKILKLISQMRGEFKLNFVGGSMISISQFYGIELDDFAHETAILSLWLAEHQMNKQFTKDFGVNIEALPLKTNCNIVQGNACRVDWKVVCPHTKEEEVFVMGNPPYLGARLQNEKQKKDMAVAMKDVRNFNNLDYIACWFFVGAKYILNSKAHCAFVSTNSICQGEQVNLLWTPVLCMDIEIEFAYTSFKWSNNAKYKAGVYCIIVGLAHKSFIKEKKIYAGNNIINALNISPYLINANNTIVKSRSKPFSEVPEMVFGNMANDNGALFLSKEEVEQLLALYPNSKDFIKKVIGSQEFIRDEERFCLWITDENKEIALSIPEVLNRILLCKTSRMKSAREATRKLAAIPWRFGEVRHKNTNSIIIPRVSSERRKYYPIGYLSKDYIVTDRAFVIYDAQLWILGLISSNMHMVWMKAVAGRLKMDYNYSVTLCYNAFPFPKITETKRQEISDAANTILDIRDYHVGETLATLYDPDKMPADLREAHHQLDLLVDSCYQDTPFANDEERLECLFKLYEKMSKKK